MPVFPPGPANGEGEENNCRCYCLRLQGCWHIMCITSESRSPGGLCSDFVLTLRAVIFIFSALGALVFPGPASPPNALILGYLHAENAAAKEAALKLVPVLGPGAPE